LSSFPFAVYALSMKTLDRYIARFVLHGFLSTLGIIGGVLILNRFYRIIELAVTRSLDLSQIFFLIGWMFPIILFHAVPIAAIAGTLLAFGRLTAGSEICAMLAAGASRIRLALFPILFSLILLAVALFNNLVLMPKAYVQFDSAGFGVGIDPIKGLKPGIVERISGRHIAIGDISPEAQKFQKLFSIIPSPLSKGNERLLILSSKGSWSISGNTIILNLIDGSIRNLSPLNSGRILKFENYLLRIPLPSDASPDPKRRPASFLISSNEKEYQAELWRRILSALIIPIFIITSIPLVASTHFAGRKEHARGAVLYSALLYFLYWLIYFLSDAMVDKYGYQLIWLLLPHLIISFLSLCLWTMRR